MIFRRSLSNLSHNIFRLRADAELRAPYTEARADIIARVSFGQGAERVLIDGFGKSPRPIDMRHLSRSSVSLYNTP